MWVVGNIAGCTRAMIPVLRCMQIGPLNDSDSLVPGAKSGAKFLPSTLNPMISMLVGGSRFTVRVVGF